MILVVGSWNINLGFMRLSLWKPEFNPRTQWNIHIRLA